MADAKTTSLNTIRAAFMRRASAPGINPFALEARLSHRLQIHGQLHRHRPAVAGHAGAGSQRHHAHRPNPARHPAAARTVIVPGHGPNRASTYWIDPGHAMAGSRDEKNDTRPTDNRKPASSYKRKPASGLKPNTGNLAHDNRKSDVEIPEASFHPSKKNLQEAPRRKNLKLSPPISLRRIWVGTPGRIRIEKMLVMPTFRTRPIPTPTNRTAQRAARPKSSDTARGPEAKNTDGTFASSPYRH